MIYEKQTFVNDSTVLMAEHLEHIEDGIFRNSAELEKTIKTVNGNTPDENGNVEIVEGGSGIHIGTDAPTDENINVWIDTNEKAESGGVDVTAEVGQTIVVEEVDANGKPTKWKAMDFPEAEQADWNASEGEPGHVLNRTHWAEVVDVELLPEQEFTFAEGVAYTPEMIPLEVGKTYKVFFDGVLYNCTAYYSVFMDMQTVTIGNGNIYGFPVGSDEPFAIATVSSAGMSGIMCTDTASHTVKVAEEVEEVHALPKKFIPLSFPLYAHIEIGMIDVKPSEIAEALENSRVVIAIENGTCYQLKSNTGASVTFWGLDGGKIRTITFLVDVNRDTFVSATNHYYLLEPIPDQ